MQLRYLQPTLHYSGGYYGYIEFSRRKRVYRTQAYGISGCKVNK